MKLRKDRTIQFAEYTKHFTDQVQNADGARNESMQRLQTIRAKRKTSQLRQLSRLKDKYGDQHTRVKRQEERIASEKEMENYLSLSIEKSHTETEIVKGGFVFKGRVLNEKAKGLPGYVVQLMDQRNNRVSRPAKTDREGFYSIVIEVDRATNKKRVTAVVLDTQGTQIHRERMPVLLNSDTLESRDIVITKGREIVRSPDPMFAEEEKEDLKTPSPAAKKKTARKKTKTNKKRKTTKKKKSSRKKVSKKSKVRK